VFVLDGLAAPMPYLSVDNVRLYYEQHGTGPPVALIHGLGSSSRDWFAQIPHLASRHRVIVCDLRGHGQSAKPSGPYSMPQFARDVAVLLRKLDAVPAQIVGLSMGGMVALELAASTRGLVRRLVVANSAVDVRLQTWSDVWFYASRRLAVRLLGMRRVGALIADRLFVKPDQERLRTEFIERWAQNDMDAYVASVDAIMGWSVIDRLNRVTAPTLLVSSEHDYTPVAAKNLAAARLPHAELAVVDGTRHALPVERPEAFNVLLDGFLLPDDDARPETTPPAASTESLRRMSAG
jgi:pimeloyl-ACP methyl ester carboxylesterase